MNDEELRLKIYEKLGLEVGSLASESGYDWKRAEKEVLDEYKASEFKKNSDSKEIDFLTIDKEKEEFRLVLESTSLTVQDYKVLITQRTDLTEDEILKLIEYGNKEVMINLAKHQSLSTQAISQILPNSVYLTKKYLIEKQTLSENHKELLLNQMSEFASTYEKLSEQLKQL